MRRRGGGPQALQLLLLLQVEQPLPLSQGLQGALQKGGQQPLHFNSRGSRAAFFKTKQEMQECQDRCR